MSQRHNPYFLYWHVFIVGFVPGKQAPKMRDVPFCLHRNGIVKVIQGADRMPSR